MAIRPKTKRRVLILVLAFTVVCGALYGGYVIRERQIRHMLAVTRMSGMDAYRRHDYGTAIADLSQYMKRRPEDADALFALAEARKSKPEADGHHITEAIGFFRRYVDLVPDNVEAQHELLRLEHQAGMTDQAIDLSQQLLARNPADPEPLEILAYSLAASGKYREALVPAQKYNDVSPTDLDGHDLTFRVMRQLKTPVKRMLDRAAAFQAKYPADPRYKLVEVMAYAAGKDPSITGPDVQKQDAKEVKNLLDVTGPGVKPPDAQFVSQAVRLLDIAGRANAAGPFLQRTTAALNDPAIRLMYVERLWEGKQNGEVVEQLKDLNPASPDVSPSLVAYKAMALHDLDKKPEADALLDALAARKDDAEAVAWSLGLRTVFHPESTDASKNFQDMEAALASDRNNGVLRLLLAQEYQKAGELDLAYEQGRIAEERLPSWTAPHLLLANILNHRHDLVAAAQEANRSVETSQNGAAGLALDPQVSKLMIFYEYAESVGDRAQMKAVLDQLEILRKDNPGEAHTLPPYVQLLSQTGQSDKAKDVIRAEMANPIKEGGQNTLLELARISRSEKLGMEESLLDTAEKKFGLTPQLAFDRALLMAQTGGKTLAEATAYLADAAKHGTGEPWEWGMVLAHFRDGAGDPGAKDAWESLGNTYPNNRLVQTALLDNTVAPSLWANDLPFVGVTVDRVKALTGENALQWKSAKAKWLLARNGPKDASDASILLGEILRHPSAASEAEPHGLQSQAMERLGNVDGAINEAARASNIAPADVLVGYRLLRLYHTAGRYGDARDTFDKIKDLPSMTPAIAQNAAAMMFRQHELYHASELLARYYNSEDPSRATTGVVGLLAMTYDQLGKVKDAGDLYLRVLDAKDLKPNVIEAAANFFAGWNQLSTARKFLAKLDEVPLKPGEKDLTLASFEERYGADPSVANKHYTDAIAAAQGEPAPVVHYTGYLIRQKRLDDAAKTADAGLTTWPDNKELQTLKALAVGLNNTPYAAQLATVAGTLTADPANPAALATVKTVADTQALPSGEAISRLQQLLKQYPNYYPPYELTVRRMMADGTGDMQTLALQLASQAVQNFADLPSAARLATIAQAQAGHWSEAAGSADTWRKLSSQQPMEANWYLALCQINLQHPGEAITTLDPFIPDAKAKPDQALNKQVLRTYAGAELLTGRQDDAEALLRPLAENSPAWRGVWLGLAKDAFHDGAAASAWIGKIAPLIPADSVEENHHLADAWFDVATHLSYAKGFDNCRDVLKPFAAKGLLDQATLLTLAAAEGEGNDPGAADAYRRAIDADGGKNLPGTSAARNNLANLLMTKGDAGSLAEAETLARQAADSPTADAGSRPYYYDTLARVYLKQGKADQAVDQFKKADAMLKNDPVIMIGWADALVRSRKMDRALLKVQEVDRRIGSGTRLSPDLQDELQTVRDAVRRVGPGARSSLTNTEISPAGRP